MMQPAHHRDSDDLPSIGELPLAGFGGALVLRFRRASCCPNARFSRANSRCYRRLDLALAKTAYSDGSMGVG